MKQIKLVPDEPFFNNVDVAVIDFPDGLQGRQRQRCKIKIEYATSDIEDLVNQDMKYDDILDHYKKLIYDIVKLHIAEDWQCVEGFDEIVKIVKDYTKEDYNSLVKTKTNNI